MTISYADSFGLVLLRWKGSLYKAVAIELGIFYVAYYLVMAVVFFLDTDGKEQMTKLAKTFEKGTSYIPLSFLLGFFVAAVLSRWWEQWNCISWPDRLMITVGTWLPGPENRLVRRTLARWSSLQAAIAWRMISVRTKKRFPTEKHLVAAGLMTNAEAQLFRDTPATHGKWWLPSIWTINLIRQHFTDKKIDSIQMQNLLQAVIAYKGGFDNLLSYDWLKIPMVYTQVATIATYGYFILCVIARQPLQGSEEVPIPFPLFTTLQFFFYMGWLKVGQFLMEPFGEDDDDFELNYILDRNTAVAFLIADEEVNSQLPRVDVDDEDQLALLRHLPHTKASAKIQDVEPPDHLKNVVLKARDMEVLGPEQMESLIVGRRPINRFRRLISTSPTTTPTHDEDFAHPTTGGHRLRTPLVADNLPGEYDPVPITDEATHEDGNGIARKLSDQYDNLNG